MTLLGELVHLQTTVIDTPYNSRILELQNQLPQETGTMKGFINSDYFKSRLDGLASDLRTAVEKLQVS